jgi:hypothetical protein
MAKGKHTGGRKPGSKNKATIERELIEETAVSRIEAVLKAAGIELSSILPLDYALAVLRHPDSTPEQRRWACEKALPFCHAKPTRDVPLQPQVAINGPAEVRLVIIDHAEQSRHRSSAHLLSAPPAGTRPIDQTEKIDEGPEDRRAPEGHAQQEDG